MRVWITRTNPGAQRTADALVRAGYTPIVEPVLTTEPVDGIVWPETVPDVVVVLSAHAADAVAEKLASLPPCDVVAVGPTTAAQLGVGVTTPTPSSSEGVLALLKHQPPRVVWVCSGEGGRDLIVQTLRDAGWQVHAVELYRRVPLTPDLNRIQSADAIVASSAEGVEQIDRHWRAVSGRMDVPLLVPSQRVAETAQALGFGDVIRCDGAGADAVIQALAAHTGRENADQQNKGFGPDTEMSEEQEAAAQASFDEQQIEQQIEKADAVPPPKQRSGSGFVAWLALLGVLVAIGGVGYLWYTLVYLDPQREVAGALAKFDTQVGALDARINEKLAALEASQKQELEKAIASQSLRVATAEAAVADALNTIANKAPVSSRQWQLAEAEYLLRIANHRLLMEQDARTAASLLAAADQILEELDEFGLFPVRAAIADELLALKRVGGTDVQGVFLRLEAIKDQVAALPVAMPEYLNTPPPAAADEEADFWSVVKKRFWALFDFRKVSREGVQPLLAPDDAIYLERNIRLTLEQAQLAALRRHQEVFDQSLANARAWVLDYLDAEAEDVQAFVAAIDELADTSLAAGLPDISGSLTALQRVSAADAAPESVPEPATDDENERAEPAS